MSTPNVPDVSTRERVCAVVPTYNCKGPLANCLEVVRRQTRPLDEIIVVDNASTDGTKEMIQERFSGSVTYIRLPENLGGSGGFDKGMRVAHEHGHDWIWCLDSDALPSETTLNDILLAPYSSQTPIVAKTCIFRDSQTGQMYPGGYPDGLMRGRNGSFPRAAWEGEIVRVQISTLCCLLVKADAAMRAGFIQTDFFIDCDDWFFSQELRSHGEILQIGGVVVGHDRAKRRFTNKWGRHRLPVENFWRTY